MTVRIVPNEKSNPIGKLADAELHFEFNTELSARIFEALKSKAVAREFEAFEANLRVLLGLKLIGFSIWERRGGPGRNVTFPARQYAVNGERRSFALLRPIADVSAQTALRDLILQAYDEYERQMEKQP
jgi:hypothetical protein